MPTVKANGIELYYDIKGDGETILFLNGVLMNTDSWIFQTRVLERGYRCVLHDFRDQLRSEKTDIPYQMDIHAHDLAALMDTLEIERCHLVGISYGGEVALMFALLYPERVRSMVIISSVANVDPLLHQQTQVWAETAHSRPETFYGSVVALSYSASYVRENPELLAAGKERLAKLAPDFFQAFTRLVRAFQAFDVVDRLDQIDVPTLVVCGELDQIKTVAHSRAIADGITNSEFVVVPGAGHAVMFESPDEINTAIIGFVEKNRLPK